MKVPKQIYNKRVFQTNEIYSSCVDTMTKYDEKIYEVINLLQTIENKDSTEKEKQEVEEKANKMIKNLDISKQQQAKLKRLSFKIKIREISKLLILENLEECSSTVIEKVRQFYPMAFDNNSIIDIEDMLFKEDGKTFDKRVNEWFNKYNQQEISLKMLEYHIMLINENETYHLIPQVVKAKIKDVIYVGIEPGYGCGRDCCNTAYNIGDAYPEDEMDEEPPFHENCQCEEVIYPYEELEEWILED